MDTKKLADFLLDPDAETVIDAFTSLRPDMKMSILSSMTVMAQYANVTHEATKAIEASPTPLAIPHMKKSLVTGETAEVRIIERRIAGEKVDEIAHNEKVSLGEVFAAIRKARATGMKIPLFDRKPNKNSHTQSTSTPHNDLKEYIFAQRMSGISPVVIIDMVKRDFKIEMSYKSLSNIIQRMKDKYGVQKFPPFKKEGLELSESHVSDLDSTGSGHLPLPVAAKYPYVQNRKKAPIAA